MQISFEVSTNTDVEVAVVDENDKVLRHLAAGVLGAENAPPDPLQPGLAQSLVWDLKDDDGRPVSLPVRLRVRAGMKPTFDRFLLFNPHGTARVISLAIGPKGHLYVFHEHATANGNSGSYSIKIYDRDGQHLRVLMPFPADIEAQRVQALGVFQDEEGRLVPRIHNWERFSLYPDPNQWRGMNLGHTTMPAVNSQGRVYWLSLNAALMALEPDGGVPYERMYEKEPLLADFPKVDASSAILAISSDDRYVYVSGLTLGGQPIPCVFRVDTRTRTAGEVFLGKADQPGKSGSLLIEPRGLVVVNGLICVADKGGNRVVVFREKDKTVEGELPVPAPDTIGIDPESGAIYVCSLASNPPSLIKLSGYKDCRELYRLTLPKAAGRHRIAVDATSKPVRIWMPAMHYGPGFTCIEDDGTRFRNLGDPRPKPAEVAAEGMRDLTVDRWRGEFYVKCNGERWFRIDDRSGKILAEIKFKGYQMANHATQLVPCRDGSLVTLMWSDNWMKRWTRDGAPLNWEGSDSNRATGTEKGIMTYSQKYLAFHNDELYQVMRIGDKKYSPR
ncbi:MAG: hypothetical protein ACUVWX_12625 [Kiritimatiellia bacterium]